jgi:L-amino acid N-acyltransferase YncA
VAGTWTSRDARAADHAAMAAIYNAGIASSQATFETEPRTADDVAGWTAARTPAVVVADGSGRVVGFARLSPYVARPCYDHVAEFGVYVAEDAQGDGAGSAAMGAVIERARALGYTKLVSRVIVGNVASRRLLARLGFREVGVHERHGRTLDGRWHDVVVVELLLSGTSSPETALRR